MDLPTLCGYTCITQSSGIYPNSLYYVYIHNKAEVKGSDVGEGRGFAGDINRDLGGLLRVARFNHGPQFSALPPPPCAGFLISTLPFTMRL